MELSVAGSKATVIWKKKTKNKKQTKKKTESLSLIRRKEKSTLMKTRYTVIRILVYH